MAKNLQSAQSIAALFDLTADQVETLRRQKVITGEGSPKQYDLLPTIQAYIKHLQSGAQYCTGAELADLFGFDGSRRIDQLRIDGVISGEGKPIRYVLRDVVKEYVAYLSDKAHGRERKENVLTLEEQKLAAEVAIKEAKAEQAKMQLKELQGSLHRAEDVEAVFTDHGMYMRSMLLAMPGKLAVDLAGEHTAAEQAEVVKREVYWILNNLADYRYDPDEYKKRVMEREGWMDRQEGEDDGE